MSDKQDILESLEWAIDTIRQKLQFGMDRFSSPIMRESRAKGVMIEAVEEITKLKKALEIANEALVKIDSSNDDMKYFNSEIDSILKEAQKQIQEIMEG